LVIIRAGLKGNGFVKAPHRGSWWKVAIVAVARKLLSIMRAMQLSGELFNERLVCNECGVGKIGKVISFST